MLFESYMILTAIAFIFFILHLTVKTTQQDSLTGNNTITQERPLIFIIIAFILFFTLWGSSGNIEKNSCFEDTVIETNFTYDNATFTTIGNGQQFNITIGSANLVAGTFTSGNESNTTQRDGVDWIINEQVGAIGLDLRFNFTGNFSLNRNMKFAHYGFFDAAPNEDIAFQLFNFQTSVFDEVSQMVDAELDFWHNFTIDSAELSNYVGEVNGGGTEFMILRIFHDTAGNTGHQVVFDAMIAVDQTLTIGISNEIEQVETTATETNTLACDTEIKDDFTMIYVFLAMAIISALLTTIRIYELFGDVENG